MWRPRDGRADADLLWLLADFLDDARLSSLLVFREDDEIDSSLPRRCPPPLEEEDATDSSLPRPRGREDPMDSSRATERSLDARDLRDDPVRFDLRESIDSDRLGGSPGFLELLLPNLELERPRSLAAARLRLRSLPFSRSSSGAYNGLSRWP